MANYYCMIAGLPDIDLKDTKPGLSLEEMREQCEEQLTFQDKKLLFYFFLRGLVPPAEAHQHQADEYESDDCVFVHSIALFYLLKL